MADKEKEKLIESIEKILQSVKNDKISGISLVVFSGNEPEKGVLFTNNIYDYACH